MMADEAQQAFAFLKRVANNEGRIVSTNDLTTLQIAQARADRRMWVDGNSMGYVVLPWDLRCLKDENHK